SMSRGRRLPKSVNQSPPCLSNTRSFGPFNGCGPHLSTTVSTLPLCMSTRWIEPPIYSCGSGAPGIMVPRDGTQLKPPLLQTYILPSGPSAAPFGPPGISATISLRPSGKTRVSRRPRISTSTTEPSGITTGPSGNSSPVARTRTFAMKILPLLSAAGGSASISHAQHLFARCYGKVVRDCQPEAAQGGCAYRLVGRDGRIGQVIWVCQNYLLKSRNLLRCPGHQAGTTRMSVRNPMRPRQDARVRPLSIGSVAPREVQRSKTTCSAPQPLSGAQKAHRQGSNRKGQPA